VSDEKQVMLPKTDVSLYDARQRLAGRHFAQETLCAGEREILYLAEGLLRLFDLEGGDPWVCSACGGDGTVPHTDNDMTGPNVCPRCLGVGSAEKAVRQIETWNGAFYGLVAEKEGLTAGWPREGVQG
jgi:hypothetical protein